MQATKRTLADQLYENEHYVITVPCPGHSGQHDANLYQHPHRYAGTWRCLESELTGVCEHEETRTDVATEDRMDFRGHYQNDIYIEVCTKCEVEV